MTFARRLRPEAFFPSDWDAAWAQGWFRMRQSLFTTHFLEFERNFHSAVWLRVGLPSLEPDKRFQALRKANRRFRVEFRPADPTGPSADQEALYARYRDSLEFEPAPTLRDLLLGDEPRTKFPTHEVNLYDGADLVAGGVFDVGDRAAAGISSYYDPAYRKHSLGKYLIYLKMEWCQARGLQWFYPGYVAPGQARFDYKWDLGAATLEFLSLATGRWEPKEPGGSVPDPLADMEVRLGALVPWWDEGLPRPSLRRYLHLDINLNPQVQGMGLFDFPVFLDAFPGIAACPPVVVVFDPRDACYHLYHCRSVYRFQEAGDDPTVFESDLLVVHQDLFATADPAELAWAMNHLSLE